LGPGRQDAVPRRFGVPCGTAAGWVPLVFWVAGSGHFAKSGICCHGRVGRARQQIYRVGADGPMVGAGVGEIGWVTAGRAPWFFE